MDRSRPFVFIVLSGASAFAKPTVYPSLNFGLPVELWSAGEGTAVKFSDVSIAGGIKAKVFFENNLGVFVDLGVGTMVSQTIDGRNVTNLKDFKPFAFYAAVGAAYRLPLGGPITLSIGAGPSYTLQSTTLERPARTGSSRDNLRRRYDWNVQNYSSQQDNGYAAYLRIGA